MNLGSTSPTGSAPRPLDGVRVLELSGIGPSRYAGMMLADLGAEVVVVERPGQPARRADTVVMRGQSSITLDLKNPDDLATLLDLAAAADVLIDPYRPGVVEKLGIGPDQCHERNPGLVYARMTGWGQDGPWAHAAGHDINYIAITGVLDAIGRADGPPQVPLNLVGDFGGGTMFMLVGVLSALVERQHTGRGRVVDAAIVDGTLSLAAFIHGLRADEQWDDARGSNLLDTGAPYYDVYATSDGRWMSVGAIEPQFYAELLRLLELTDTPDLPGQNDRSRWEELRALIAGRFAKHSLAHWADVFAGTDACVAPILTWVEAAEHPQIAARQALIERDGILQPAPAPRFDGQAPQVASGAPTPGGDTGRVLADWLAQADAGRQ